MNNYFNFRILHSTAFDEVYDSSDSSLDKRRWQIIEWSGISGIDDNSNPASADVSYKDFGVINLEEYKWAEDDQVVDYCVIRDTSMYPKFFRIQNDNVVCSNLLVLLFKSGQIKMIHVSTHGDELKFCHEEIHNFKTKNWTIFKEGIYSSKICAYMENYDDK